MQSLNPEEKTAFENQKLPTEIIGIFRLSNPHYYPFYLFVGPSLCASAESGWVRRIQKTLHPLQDWMLVR